MLMDARKFKVLLRVIKELDELKEYDMESAVLSLIEEFEKDFTKEQKKEILENFEKFRKNFENKKASRRAEIDEDEFLLRG